MAIRVVVPTVETDFGTREVVPVLPVWTDETGFWFPRAAIERPFYRMFGDPRTVGSPPYCGLISQFTANTAVIRSISQKSVEVDELRKKLVRKAVFWGDRPGFD